MNVADGVFRAATRLLPPAVVRRVEPVVRNVPDRLGSLFAPGWYADVPEGPPQPLAMAEGSVRLIVGRTNTAGQGYQWARCIDELDDHVAISIGVVNDEGFRFPVHRAVPARLAGHSADWHRAEFAAITSVATHVLIESARPLFGPLFGRSIEREVRALQRRGIRVAIVLHGSDVRDVRAHQQREPHSPFGNADLVSHAAELDAAAARTRAAIARLGVPLFASTPNVQFDVPTATWLPIVVDSAPWSDETPPFERDTPVVLHAPSDAGLKGTEVVDEVLGRLDAEGMIDYRRLTGVPHEEVMLAYRDADIVVDSLRMGGYGAGACEAMAAGRLVLSHVNPTSRLVVEASVGQPLPIWPATVDTLERELLTALTDRDRSRAMAARGPEYVRVGHSGAASAAVLASFLAS